MLKIKTTILYFFFSLSVLAGSNFSLLPANINSKFFLNPKENNIYLRFLNINNTIVDIGKLSYKVSLFNLYNINFTTISFINIYMYPENSKFFVKHFYAALGIGFDYKISKYVFLSLLPLYHESAHLADGYIGDIKKDSKIISNESLQIKLIYNFKNLIIPLQIDYFWHSIERNLKYNVGAGIQYSYFIIKNKLSLFITYYCYLLNQKNIFSFNYEFLTGIFLKNKQKIVRTGLYYENQYGLGQDYMERIKGMGLEVGLSSFY